MKKDLQILKALIKEIKENLQEELKVKGKVVKDYKQNGDKSYTVEYEDGTKETIYVSHEDWDAINDDAKKVDEKKLSTKQKFIAKQAPPEDEINAADFEKLRGMKKEDHEGQDHEVSMANNSLDSILWAANELKKHLGDQERDIPAWIQDHITNAENYIIQAAKNFHDYGSEEAPQEEPTADDMSLASLMEVKKKPVKEVVKKVGSKYNVYSKKGKKLGSHPSKKKAQKQMAAIEISKQGK